MCSAVDLWLEIFNAGREKYSQRELALPKQDKAGIFPEKGLISGRKNAQFSE